MAAATAAALAENPPSRIARGGFPLAGRSEHPDPLTHAYRQDLADVALAGRVVASHYAEPLLRHVATPVSLLPDPDETGLAIAVLNIGDALRILDCSLGWSWGYGPNGQVGYVRSDALTA